MLAVAMRRETQRGRGQARVIWPTFFLVGAQNSGTTSLYSQLRQHSEVFLPPLKEPHFFSDLPPLAGMRYPIARVAEQDAYLRLFNQAGDYKAIGDASTSYLWDPGAPYRIHAANPQAKIVMLLRDPIERAQSHYLMDVRDGWQHLPFREALQQDWQSTEKRHGMARLYIDLGLYCRQVERYLKLFGPERVCILSFTSLDAQPMNGARPALSQVVDFLGLDSAQLSRIDTSRRENEFTVSRWRWVSRIAGARWARRLGLTLVPASLGSTFFIKQLVFEPLFLKRADKPPIPAEVKEWLISIFKDDVSALEKLLGRSLPDLRRTW
jgi:hypothetical protein